MSTPWNKIYEAFFNKIEKDGDFFAYYNVEPSEALDIAKTRAKGYLKESVAKLTLSCTPDIDFNNFDETLEIFYDDLTNIEIDLLANLMRENYYEKDLSLLKAFQLRFSPKDLNVFSPANERKTFMEMFNEVKRENRKLISQYVSRDRLTGKLKSINFSKYYNE